MQGLAVAAAGASRAGLFLVRRPARAQVRLRLFCFHHAGGNASSFLPWAAWLPAGIEVVGVQLPGRGARRHEAPSTDALALFSQLGPVLAQSVQGLPYAFFGHSMGAWLAFEMARWLAGQGLAEPVHLFASGRGAPHLPLRLPPIDELSDAHMLSEMLGYGGMDRSMLDHPDLLQLFLPLIRADLRMHRCCVHRPGQPLSCPITALVATDDPLCTVDDAAQWQVHTRGAFDLRQASGGHFFFHGQPERHLKTLLAPLVS
jgi:surfactin synthase thioesterase subunit